VFRRLLALRMVPHVRTAEDMAADLVAFAQRWQPDLVVTDPAVYAAPLAAAAAGAPLVRHLWGLDMLRHIALPGNGVSAEDDHRAEWPAELVELYERYDTKPQADVAVSTLDTCPASMQLPDVPNRMPVRYTSYNGAVVAPAWLLDPPERPRVCVTWGSSTTRLVGPEAFLVPRILEALSGLDIEVVVTIGSVDRPRLGEVPDGIRVVEGMPLELVLPTCTAIIHQSGAGATLTSAYHGVPQVTIPLVADQNMVSQRLSATGAGIGIGGNDDGLPDGGAIREAVTAIVTTDGPRDAAHRLRAEMRGQPAPSEVVRLLEELV
jgi:UDP:flavonoid glycosyltransferase YjiC (YdhE family)